MAKPIQQTTLAICPRSYDLDANIVHGIAYEAMPGKVEAGQDVSIHYAAGLEAFASQRGNQSCLTAPNNGINQPVGILLAERLANIRNENGQISAEANWMSVLRRDERDAMPFNGYGWLDPRYMGAVRQDLHDELELRFAELQQAFTAANNGGAGDALAIEDEMRKLQAEAILNQNRMYVACVLDPQLYQEDHSVDGAALRGAFVRLMEGVNNTGVRSGALIRVRRGNEVIADLCQKIEGRWLREEERLETPAEAFSSWAKNPHVQRAMAQAKRHGALIDILGYRTLTAAPLSNDAIRRDLLEKGMQAKHIVTYINPRCYTDRLLPRPKTPHGVLARKIYAAIANSVKMYPSDPSDPSSQKAPNRMLRSIHAGSNGENPYLIDRPGLTLSTTKRLSQRPQAQRPAAGM